MSEIMSKLEILRKKYPGLRLGQLLCSAFNYTALYYISDEQLIHTLAAFYKVDLEKEYKESLQENKQEIVKPVETPVEKAELPEYKTARQVGLENKGRIYIHKGTDVKAVKEDELDEYLKQGYSKGKKDKKIKK